MTKATIHPGAQIVYESLLGIRKLMHEAGGVKDGHVGALDSATADKIDDDIADMLDLFAGWCRPELSLEHMIEKNS